MRQSDSVREDEFSTNFPIKCLIIWFINLSSLIILKFFNLFRVTAIANAAIVSGEVDAMCSTDYLVVISLTNFNIKLHSES